MPQRRTSSSDLSRREFGSRLGAAAGIAAGGQFWTPSLAARARTGRVIGANDRVVLGVIGVRGQGNALKRGFARLSNVDLKTLCDVDQNLEGPRVSDAQLADVPTFKPAFTQDLRRVLDDPDIDGVIIATPNHWHALASIWALQAGKHVFVEKPSSYTVWEGRRMIQVAEATGKVLQTGYMNRSRPAVRDAIAFVHGGGLGRVYMARGLCFKPRPSIGKYPDGPLTPGEKYALTVTSTSYEPAWDAAYLARVDYDLWLGPAPLRPFNRNRFHYNWHWHWDYGNGDTGNQGPHQFDIARWALRKDEHPVHIQSAGGYFGSESSQETPDTQTSLFTYADGTVLEFATRGQFTNAEGDTRIGVLVHGTKGWLWIDETGRRWQSYFGPKNEPGPGTEDGPEKAARAALSTPGAFLGHYQNFVDAIRADKPSLVTCGAVDGHLSSALPHLANISYRVGRSLTFNGRTETFSGDKEADQLLTRKYRKGFEVPK
jgi:predicted dehydrogenase